MRSDRPFSFAAILAFPLAILLAAAALGGILLPAAYARETPLWAAQGVGQDWVDLAGVAPWLAFCAWRVLRGSRVFALLLGGTLVYVLYSMVLYAFAVHFNALFLVYTAALGVSFYGTAGMLCALRAADVRSWFGERAPVRVAGGYAALLGLAFAALWLSEVVPAIVRGVVPRAIVEAGLVTNPVEILDLGIVLPAFVAAGVALMRRRRLGYYLAPPMLAFGILMDVALIAMSLSMSARGIEAPGPPVALFAAMTAASVGVLWWFLSAVTRGPAGRRRVGAEAQ